MRAMMFLQLRFYLKRSLRHLKYPVITVSFIFLCRILYSYRTPGCLSTSSSGSSILSPSGNTMPLQFTFVFRFKVRPTYFGIPKSIPVFFWTFALARAASAFQALFVRTLFYFISEENGLGKCSVLSTLI